MMKSSQQALFALALALALVGCMGKKVPEPSPSDLFGPSTATGTIVGTGASLYRRGTHVLLVDGHSRFFLESKSVNLGEYEGKMGVVRGEITANSHPSFFPVIEVESVTLLEAEPLIALQKYDVPGLMLSFEAPRAWESSIAGDRLVFFLKGEKTPVIAVEKKMMDALPEGLPVRVGGRNGVRIIEEQTGKHVLYIERVEREAILFTYFPQGDDPAPLRDAFYAMLKTVEFASTEESSSSSSLSSSQSSPFIPCGGPAHVLCPSGMYCAVREFDTGIGACKPL